MTQAIAVRLDQAPAGRAESGIETEDSQFPLPLAGGVRGGEVEAGTLRVGMPFPSPSRKREGS
ncbi:hypothetical protein GCM10023325_05420 [Sphingomonas lutea]